MNRPLFPSAVFLSLVCSLGVTGCAELAFPLQGCCRRRDVDIIPPSRPVARAAGGVEVAAVRQGAVTRHPNEADYFVSRRRAAKVPVSGPSIGVALSGGGVRSANFNLGTLQGLEDAGLLARVDYLSCVSGGGYIGGWYVSHLRTREELASIPRLPGRRYHFSDSRGDLLNIEAVTPSEAVPHLRERAGVFGHGGTKILSLSRSVGHLLLTAGPNLVMDMGLHLHPSPGKWNAVHPIYQYRRLLIDTYLGGWDDIGGKTRPYLAHDINSPGSETPFLISCGALANSRHGGKDRDADGRPIQWSGTHHFEFTRLWCGSPLIGWIDTDSFDLTVADVNRKPGGETTAELLAGPFPGLRTKPFKLSSAMAASGAAVDSAGFGRKTRAFTNWLLTAVNFNLRYQTANFTQDRTEWYMRPLDRLRETTTDRFGRSPRSNVLQISDGAHFDNLGVYALLRREVDTIMAFDATADSKYGYKDLKNLLSLILQSGGQYEINPGEWAEGERDEDCLLPRVLPERSAPADPVWTFRVRNRSGHISTVHYVKNSRRADDGDHPLARQLPPLITLDARNKELHRENFPHVSTIHLMGWSRDQFDAYRDNGRYLARRAAERFRRPR